MPPTTELPKFRTGDLLLAEDLNTIVSMIPAFDAGPGIEISEHRGRIVIGLAARSPLPRQTFWATITGHTEDGPNRYRYNYTEAAKTATGYGGWTDKPAGRTGVCFNLTEDINDGSGVEGNGIDLDGEDFPDGFTLRPCPDGTPVLLTIVTLADASAKEAWFSWENPVDGTCEEPP
jgi:hypothetical protein